MSVEQRLVEVFQASGRFEPAPDLWNRVVHSIEEDRLHRVRIVRTTALILAAVATFATVVLVSIEDGRFGRQIHRPTLELLEVLGLTTLLVTLGPAIRRFGRNYAGDLWPRWSTLPDALLRLLDVAFYLVGAGYILLSTEFEFTERVFDGHLGDQLSDASIRVGGLLATFGVLHALTLFVLPLVALLDNSTRRGRTPPTWVALLLVACGGAGLLVMKMMVAIGLGDSG